jgi:hypothetical protein
MKIILTILFCLGLLVAGYCMVECVGYVMKWDFITAQHYLFTCGLSTLVSGIVDEIVLKYGGVIC